MLPCSGDDLAVSYDLDPLGNDVLTIVGGHLDVHLSPIAFEGGGHFYISCPILELADFSLMDVYCSYELVDVAVGFGEALVNGGCSALDCGDEAVSNGVCGVLEVTTLVYVEYCFGQSRGDGGVVPCKAGGDADVEQGQ